MNFLSIELIALMMFFIGFYGLIISKNVIKSIVFFCVVETGIILFWIGLGYREGMVPPIQDFLTYEIAYISDPLPQALMITAIIIGLSVTAVNLVMLMTLVRRVKSTDWDTIKIKSLE